MSSKNESVVGSKDLSTSVGTLGLMTLLTGGIMKLMGDYMFGMGNDEKIPKGVVKEMTHGMVEGFFDYIKEKDYDLDELRKELAETKEKLEEVEQHKKEAEGKWESLQKALDEAERRKKEAEKKAKQQKEAEKKPKVKTK